MLLKVLSRILFTLYELFANEMVAKAGNPPTVTLGELLGVDGSAEYTCNGYTVVGAVNGPIEVQRRDELPEEAAIDVIVRPIAGVGGKSRFLGIKLRIDTNR